MTVSTEGIQIKTRIVWLRNASELLSSMRFAISLLSVICIASVIGTVLKQAEPFNNYVNQFGPYWADVFDTLSLYTVYSAWWFLLILAFLVLSTSLCISRNAPKILVDIRQYKEGMRSQSLKAFGHKGESMLSESVSTASQRIQRQLSRAGWKIKTQDRVTPNGQGVMVAAKKGAANKLGYLAAHSSIVLICVGALFDGDMVVRAQMWYGDKTAFDGGGMIADVPAQHRLSPNNPTYRGNLLVTEGTQASTAILSQSDGVVLQDLPFSVELKKFIVEYYSTGMPKLFASDIVIHDKATGEQTAHRVEVNHPVSFKGVEIYQSSFDDGGSTIRAKALPLGTVVAPFKVEGVIGTTTNLSKGNENLSLEYTGLRVINVENMVAVNPRANLGGTDVRAVDLGSRLKNHLGSGATGTRNEDLRNVGPSFGYKLRDGAGQAREFNNYMFPVDMDDQRVFLWGVRDTPAEPFRYLRVPVDDNDSAAGFIALRTALANEGMRNKAVERYMKEAEVGRSAQDRDALRVSAQRMLALFSGTDPFLQAAPSPGVGLNGVPLRVGGLTAMSYFLEQAVPDNDRERTSDAMVSLLNALLFELVQVSRDQASLPELARDAASQTFLSQSVLALSDSFFYPAPMVFAMDDFDHVQASVFQVAKAPGKTVVYLGCLFLIIGVFAMLYVRERRIWVWLSPNPDGTTHAQMALSSNRKTMDGDKDFDQLKQRLIQVAP
ncbi:MAG: cytochrome c biogenesis protein ResB [Burkholderiaceae bacterium]|jgi:cytochrome c biogenesis protein|nr:Cytochrome c biogenesis protein CcsB [Betaproteobacteria bacterium MOLA814]|tara:strand:+ start:689 stop:2851 length:2163 start_codon:yes stop_codon:yes gene_type:complete